MNGSKENNYEKDYIKIKFHSDDELPLNEQIKSHAMTIVVRSVFEEDGKLYPQLSFKWHFVWIIRKLKYEKIDASKGIDINKTSLSKECKVCHYWFLKDVGFKFEPHVCNGCHDLLRMAYGLENIAILSTKGATFRSILWGISRNEGLRRLKNSVLEHQRVL